MTRDLNLYPCRFLRSLSEATFRTTALATSLHHPGRCDQADWTGRSSKPEETRDVFSSCTLKLLTYLRLNILSTCQCMHCNPMLPIFLSNLLLLPPLLPGRCHFGSARFAPPRFRPFRAPHESSRRPWRRGRNRWCRYRVDFHRLRGRAERWARSRGTCGTCDRSGSGRWLMNCALRRRSGGWNWL